MNLAAAQFLNQLDAIRGQRESELPFLAGRQGYRLPNLAEMDAHRLSSETSVPGISLSLGPEAQNNWVVLPRQEAADWSIKLRCELRCCDNVVVLGPRTRINGTLWFQGSRGLMVFAGDVEWWSFLDVRLSSNEETFFWGARSTSNGASVVMQGDRGNVAVGEDCMFATDVTIRNSDLHGMIDMETGHWLNPPGHVHLEPHVWLGQGAKILKNATVGYGSIVAAGAVVTGDLPRFSAAGGIPARVIRRNVSSTRGRTPEPGLREKLLEAEPEVISNDALPGFRFA
ncbi:MAG: acyltransferase [Acidobacteriaceae bacterium]|nr:acyltransferase [Acidobacteriaceae bacterium]